MALYLVQHGKCVSKDVDPDRPLTQDGIADVKRISEVAKGYNVKVTGIIHSGKTRALQTADLFAEALIPEEGVKSSDGLNPNDDVKAYAEKIGNGNNKMIVGHLPFMEKLASYMITGSVDIKVFKFQNGGIVCLDMIDNSWVIKWALMPEIGSGYTI